jgi:ABC-type dipeptide/oligopeptide/nickel transport system permease subunit
MATITRPLTTRDRAIELNVISRKQRSLWQDAWYRLVRNKMAVAGMVVIVLAAVLAVLAPWISPYDPLLQHTGRNAYEPFWGDQKYYDPQFVLGTDWLGRDLLSRLIWSARVSMVVGVAPVTIIFVVGVTVGMLAGYMGGWVDQLLMRITDVIYAFPDLLFLLILVATLRGTDFGNIMGGLLLIFVGLAIVNWVGMARLMRGQVLSLKEKEFVEAARAVGATPVRIMFRHIFPNALAPLLVALSFGIPGAMLAEATLSFLGIGLKPPTTLEWYATSWGVMVNEGFVIFATSQWPVLLPAFCIAIVMLAFTFLGDGLRDALDPRMKI